MTDLIERLRRAPADEVLDLNLYEEAADRIERLQHERDEAIKYRDDEFALRDAIATENTRLRETLKACEYEFVCLIPRVTEPYRTTLDGVLAVIRKALKGV
jgi:hypothetical protein